MRIKQEFLSEETPYNDVIDLAAASAAASPISRDGSTGTPNTDELYGSDEENDIPVTNNAEQDTVEIQNEEEEETDHKNEAAKVGKPIEKSG